MFLRSLVVSLLFFSPVFTWADPVRTAVVKIHSSRRPPDFLRPWTKGPLRQATGSGVIIDGKRILTNAHVVQYSSRLLVQGYQSTERMPAKIVGFAPEMDLALLEVDDDAFFDVFNALSLLRISKNSSEFLLISSNSHSCPYILFILE